MNSVTIRHNNEGLCFIKPNSPEVEWRLIAIADSEGHGVWVDGELVRSLAGTGIIRQQLLNDGFTVGYSEEQSAWFITMFTHFDTHVLPR